MSPIQHPVSHGQCNHSKRAVQFDYVLDVNFAFHGYVLEEILVFMVMSFAITNLAISIFAIVCRCSFETLLLKKLTISLSL